MPKINIKLLACLLALGLLSACSGKGHEPAAPWEAPPFTLAENIETRLVLPGGQPVEPGIFLARLRGAEIILMGEQHDSVCDHLAQAAVLEFMAQTGMNPVLGLEMVSRDKQKTLDRFNAGEITLAELPAALNWKTDFELYRPILEVAEKWRVPVQALNLPREVVQAARKQGEKILDRPPYARWKPTPLLLPLPEQQAELEAVYKNHFMMMGQKKSGPRQAMAPQKSPQNPGQAPNIPQTPPRAITQANAQASPQAVTQANPQANPQDIAQAKAQAKAGGFKNFLLAQALWDSAMAENALDALLKTQRPVLVLAGTMHVDYGRGIAWRINAAAPEARVLLLRPWRMTPSVEFPGTLPPENMADIYYLCQRRQK